jgi:hypothetical protein
MSNADSNVDAATQPQFFSSDLCSGSDSQSSGDSDVRFKLYISNAQKWWKVDILLNALSALNSPVSISGKSSGDTDTPVVYNTDHNRVEVSSSSFLTPFGFRRALARGLVYAFDNARGNLDYTNVDHVSCTSIRALNISGECDLWAKWLDYFGEDPLGKEMYSMKQRCIRKKVEEQMLLKSAHSGEAIRESIDRVWERCFRDHWPFTTEPHMDTRFRDSPMKRTA